MSSELTRAQKLMVDDGLPPELILTPEQRSTGWAGKRAKPTAAMTFAAPKKGEDPSTKALRKEMAKAEERKKAERFARLAELKQQRAKAQIKETDEMKTNTQPSKADQVKGLRESRAAAKAPKADKAASSKKAAKAKARAPVSGKAASGPAKAIRPGSKLEIVVGLLTRKGGCTSADILAATEWPAVSVPQQARAAGLTLRQEKDGKVTRYWGTPAA